MRRAALLLCWLAAAGWGVYYLAALGSTNESYAADAIVHFVIGYAWASAAMARPLSMPLALFATAAAGAYMRLALGMGTAEVYFAWAGPLAAVALSDTTRVRNFAYSLAAFAVGFVAVLWLSR